MRKVAIVGSAETWPEAPFHDESWEIWTLNNCFNQCPRIDRLFELHDEVVLVNDAADSPGIQEEIRWLKENTTVDVVLRKPLDWVPRGTEYPLDVIIKEFGDYFTNTVSYMIALAIYEGVEKLGIYGVHMAHATEYAHQRPSCEYFIGLARGRGIPVHIPVGSSLLSSRGLYGEQSRFTSDVVRQIESLTKQRDTHAHQAKIEALHEAKMNGALEMLQYIKATYGSW